MSEPQTATEVMMLDMEQRRIEMRDRRVAMAVAAKVVEEWFKPDQIEDMRDARQQITDIAEFAAYTAIQEERKLHAGDMAALKAWSEVKLAEAMLKPQLFVVPASADTLPKGQDRETGLGAEQG